MPKANFYITPGLIAEICKGFGDPDGRMRGFKVTKNALPLDSRVVSCSTRGALVQIVIESDSVRPGEVLPAVELGVEVEAVSQNDA